MCRLFQLFLLLSLGFTSALFAAHEPRIEKGEAVDSIRCLEQVAGILDRSDSVSVDLLAPQNIGSIVAWVDDVWCKVPDDSQRTGYMVQLKHDQGRIMAKQWRGRREIWHRRPVRHDDGSIGEQNKKLPDSLFDRIETLYVSQLQKEKADAKRSKR